jgi:uncharacterized SAM-dependent methyltransferase
MVVVPKEIRESLIELGSGSSTKTRILLNQLLTANKRISTIFPIDISYEMVQERTITQLRSQFPRIDVIGIRLVHIAPLPWPVWQSYHYRVSCLLEVICSMHAR